MYYRVVLLWILVIILLIIRIYLFIYPIDHSAADRTTSTNPPVTVYICPQIPSSRGYFRVDITDNFLVNYSTICHPDDTLLVYILSKADHIDRRQAIRRTWAKRSEYYQLAKTCFVFLIGLTNNSTLNKELQFEVLNNRDMVQFNVNETYQNIIYKEVGGLKWSHLYASHIRFLFKTDDDIIIDSLLLSDVVRFFISNQTEHSKYLQKQDKLKEFLQQISVVNKFTFFKGMTVNGHKMMTKGKFGLKNLAWNHENLPGYCRGSGYMLSSFVRDRLYRASLCYALEYVPWAGDVFVSGSLANAAAVHCSLWSAQYAQAHDGCAVRFENQSHLLLCSTPMHIGRLHMEDYDQSWTAILQRHLVTPETNEKAKKKQIALSEEETKNKLMIKQSIIDQVKNDVTSKEAPIVPLTKMEEKLDE